jgi:hypothetical protein
MRSSPAVSESLDRLLALCTLVLGAIHAWVGRYSMNPDGMSYLDVGQSFFRHDWANAINAWWSPVYPWTVGVVVGIVKPSPRWEFPVVHAVNFVFFGIALLAFRFLVRGFLAFPAAQPSEAQAEQTQAQQTQMDHADKLPDWVLWLLAYPIFWWTALEVETLYGVGPDMAVLAVFCLASGMLLRLRVGDKLWKFVLFGVILGIGYWTKAILFPLGFVILAVGYWWRRSQRSWRVGMATAGVVFLCVSAPFILLLSHQKGRFTFGDSGRVAFAWMVSPRTQTRNWQGREPESGTPTHPTRQLFQHPPVFEFDGPVSGTYPPWTDPSYWNEGLRGHFRLKPQIEVLVGTVSSEIRLLILSKPALIVGVIALALLSGWPWWSNVRSVWPLVAMSATGLAMYLPLLVSDRYLGGFALVLFLALIAAAQFRAQERRAAIYLAIAASLTLALGTADYTVRVVTHHFSASAGVGPNSTLQDAVAAEQLWRMGLRPGDKVAVIEDGAGAYWARLAKLRIVAEIMDMNHGSQEFWNASTEVQQNVFKTFAQAHATAVVSVCPACPPEAAAGWQRIAGTPYCMRRLVSGP